jgi:hypothetical protein
VTTHDVVVAAAQARRRPPSWVLPLQIGAVVLVALTCVAASVWGFFTVQAASVPAPHEAPAWLVAGWDGAAGWVRDRT